MVSFASFFQRINMKNLTLNPWISMWTNPRKTIKAVLEYNPMYGFFYLAAITFLQGFFFFVLYNGLIFPNFLIASLIALIVSPFIGAGWFYFFSWILFFTGRWFKGKANFHQIKASFAWSRIPLIIDLVTWFSLALFISEPILVKYDGNFSIVIINLINLTTTIWAFVLLVMSLKEVNRYSYVRSILNVVIANIFASVMLFIVFSIFKIIMN